MLDRRLAAEVRAEKKLNERRHRENVQRLDAVERLLARLNGQMAVVLVILAALLGNMIYRMVG